LLEFLGVDPDFQPSSFAARNTVASKSRIVPLMRRGSVRRVADGIRRVGGRRMARTLSRGLRSIPVVNRRGQRAALAPEVRRRLEDEYREEIELAGRLLGRDLEALWSAGTDVAAGTAPG
jgi:hypothetical protein